MFRTNRKQQLLFVIAIAIWLLSGVFTTKVNDSSLEALGVEVEEQIAASADELDDAVIDALGRLSGNEVSEWELIEQLPKEADTYYLISDMAWSGQSPSLDAELPEIPGVSALQMPDGAYLHVHRAQGKHHIHGLRKVLDDPPYENRYLKKGASGNLNPPKGIALTRDLNGIVVRAPSGEPFIGINWSDPNQESVVSTFAWWLRAFALFLLLPILWWVCTSLSKAFGDFAAVAVALVATATMTYLVPKFFAQSGMLFDPTLYATSTVLASLGHLLVLSICVLFFSAFVRHALQTDNYPGSNVGMVVSLSGLLVLARVIDLIIIGTVTDSTIDLNLFQIQHFGIYSLIAILASALVIGAWVILSYACINRWWPERFSRNYLIVLLVFAVASTLVHHSLGERDTVLIFWPFVIILIIYLRGPQQLRSAKLILVVAVMAVFHAHVLNNESGDREKQERVVLAERLAVAEDPILERLYAPINNAIRKDQEFIRLLSNDDPCPIQEIERRLRDTYFSEGYWERYQISVNVFDADNSFRCDLVAANQASWDELYDLYGEGFQVPGVIDLRTTDSSNTDVLYVSMIPIPRSGELGLSGYVFLRFTPRSAPEELGFPELLLAGEDPIDSRIRRYAFSEYRNTYQVRQFGDKAYPVRWIRHISEGPNWFIEDGYKDLAYRNGEITVLMGTLLPKPLDKATTFSYLFMFYIILGGVLLVCWWLLVEQGGLQWTLRSKVRSTLILFVLIGSVFFGFGARQLLVNSFAQRVDSDLREKTHSVLVELQHKVGNRDRFSEDMKTELDYLLRKFSKVFFSDITLYDLEGSLLATSRPQLFDAGLIGKRMAPAAFKSIALEGTSEFIHNERIGGLTYRSAYVPFMNDKGKVLAYLDLPYFARQSELDNGLSALLVAIVNLFALLFALSMLAALFISNWTTRPLAILERSLAKVDLASTNSPLKYGGKDEIGRLVEVYNDKVNELKESAERLARSERESAWREMARQVAHEIKNPLTPMKLSIQHFKRTWSPDVPDAQDKLNRFSEGMVGQIDTLSRIAEEFAHFAQMPPSRDEKMDLADAARNAMELFKGSEDVEVSLTVAPDSETFVVADSDHLVRVFNNLIKNAVQAIPEDIEGQIRIDVKSDEKNVLVSVHDNGNGIPDEIRERIFMPNFTTRSTGMGLGLAMVKRMVENSGGEVWFESTIGQGTTFYVSLPKSKE